MAHFQARFKHLKTEKYAITLTPSSNKPVKYFTDMQEVAIHLANLKISIHDFYLELKKDNTLHLHGVATGPKKIHLKGIQTPGWQIFLKKLTDPDKWYEYMTKNTKSKIDNERVITKHFFRHNYGFDLPQNDGTQYDTDLHDNILTL